MRFLRITAIVLALTLICAVGFAEIPQMSVEEYPPVDGSTAMLPLSYALMSKVTGISVEDAKLKITHHKTTNSFYSLINGEADILIVGKPANEVYDYAKEQGVELLSKPIGVDALVFLISDRNPVDSVAAEQIRKVYTGEITNWAQLGGEDLSIIAYQRNATAGSQVMMENVVMQGEKMTDAPSEFRPSDMGELVEVVSSYRNTADAIGYSVYFYVTNMYIEEGIKLLAIDGVAPSNETISRGEYPFTQNNYVVIRADSAPDSPERKLYDFFGTPDADELLLANNYVPADEHLAE